MAFPLDLGFMEPIGVEVAVDLSGYYNTPSGETVYRWTVMGLPGNTSMERIGSGSVVSLRERVHLGLMVGGVFGIWGPGKPLWGLEGQVGRQIVRVTKCWVEFRVYPFGLLGEGFGRIYLIVPIKLARLGFLGDIYYQYLQVRGKLEVEDFPQIWPSALRAFEEEQNSFGTITSATIIDGGSDTEVVSSVEDEGYDSA